MQSNLIHRVPIFTFLILIINSCSSKTTIIDIKNPVSEFAYYSDYFVFIADDHTAPLVIPLDLNWSAIKNGYEIEFKSWYGTQNDWPIIYTNKKYNNSPQIPLKSFQHKNIEGFNFNQEKKEITLKIPTAPKLTMLMPDEDQWVLAPAKNEIHKETYACKTTVRVGNETKNGWIVYEKIRWKKEEIVKFGDFETFFWIPLVINGNLYHFEQHKAEKIGFKWSNTNGKINVEEVSDFTIEVTKTVEDPKSGRTEIPKEVKISAEKNNLTIALLSTGEQAGHGKKYPKGLAYYRQSLLISNQKGTDAGYGMMELILEDN